MALTPVLCAAWLLFTASGAAALIYEIVWQQLLQLVIGSSTLSLGVLLGVYMGGMCIGSIAGPRWVSVRQHPMRVYALLELGIGACGLLILGGMPLVERLYVAWGGEGPFGVFLRACAAAICLLPPTVLMGATLPVISRWVESHEHGRDRLGYFYAGNILGAVFGTLLAGFYLLRVYDMNVATYTAVGINVAVAAIAWSIARTAYSAPAHPPLTHSARSTEHPAPTFTLFACMALSGFSALTAEVVWTRQLTLIFSATVYTFSIVLAVFLIGLGLGSGLGAALAKRTDRPAFALGWCQFLSVPAILWSAVMLSTKLPFMPVAGEADTAAMFRIDTIRTLWAILPGPILWGASFPLALAAATRVRRKADATYDAAHVVGGVYAANTVGAITGAIGASTVLMTWLGSAHTQELMMGVSAVAGLVALWPGTQAAGRTVIAGAAAAALAFASVVPAVPGVLVAYGRHAASWVGDSAEIIYMAEGQHASIAVSRLPDGVLNYHNAGKIQASSQPQDMRLQRMLGHLTTVLPSHPRSVLVIGCGAGVTAGAVSVNPNVEHVTIVDIEPLVPKAAETYFAGVNHAVLRNPKVHVVVDDARHFLMTTTERFDAITSDPLDPWVKGAATLYTKEFFDTARDHLNEGGVMTLFVQLYESSAEAVKSEVATFFDVFPEGLMFGNTFDGSALDTVLVGPISKPSVDVNGIDEMLRSPSFAPVRRSLGEIGLYSASDLFATYAARARDLQPWIATAEINRDRNLRLQYLAGLSLNRHDGNRIYHDILQYRVFPDDLFVGSSTSLWGLRQAIEGARE